MYTLILWTRLETVNLKKIHSLAKVIGTAITVSGAMVMTLYKGPIINILFTHGGGHHSSTNASSEPQHWVTGIITLISCIFGWSGFFILQVNSFPFSAFYLLSINFKFCIE